MLSKKLEKELNKQNNAALFSAYLYLSMASYLDSKNLTGFAHWMKMQYKEEQLHAQKLYDYVNERGGRVIFSQIESPKTEWKDVIEVFKDVYSHEQKVTGLINNLVNISLEEKDNATVNMIQWFVSEQVEEEASASDIFEKLKYIDWKGPGLFMMDRELIQRYVSPINHSQH